MRRVLWISLVLGLPSTALVLANTQTIDGLNIDPATWGVASIAVQDTNTRFGDNFNELNQLFVDSDATNIYIGIPGNIADNNALVIFIDTSIGVGNTVLATEPGGSCPGNVPTLLRLYNNTVMETGFTPDYSLLISVGTFPGQSLDQLVYAADLTDLNTLSNISLGIGAVGSGNGNLTGSSGVQIAIDNSNTAGVGAWDPNNPVPDPNLGQDPTTATTGYEIAIPRALLGLDTPNNTDVAIFAYISNNGQDTLDGVCFNRAGFGSNQGLPGLAGSDNLGLFSGVSAWLDFSLVPGSQFVITTIPGTP